MEEEEGVEEKEAEEKTEKEADEKTEKEVDEETEKKKKLMKRKRTKKFCSFIKIEYTSCRVHKHQLYAF